jgi:hypothetical protein
MSGERIFWDPAIHGPEYETFEPPQPQ